MYSIEITKKATKALGKLVDNDYEKIKRTIVNLGSNPRPVNCLKLTGRDGWRVRIGVYRIIYIIDDSAETIMILDIGHRRDIYQ